MKLLQKGISCLLCLCLCMGLLPAAFAEEPENEDYLVWENEEPALEANVAKPTITTQPKNTSAVDGTQATFTVTASGTGLSYQWQYRTSSTASWTNSTAASGKTKSYTVNARTAINGYQYRCKVSNAAGSATSSVVTLTVSSSAVTKPTITKQPANFSAPDGTQTTVSITATGSNLKYQWQYRKNSSSAWTNSVAASATTKTLTVNARTAINGYQ